MHGVIYFLVSLTEKRKCSVHSSVCINAPTFSDNLFDNVYTEITDFNIFFKKVYKRIINASDRENFRGFFAINIISHRQESVRQMITNFLLHV